jgi:hypothetical protein
MPHRKNIGPGLSASFRVPAMYIKSQADFVPDIVPDETSNPRAAKGAT